MMLASAKLAAHDGLSNSHPLSHVHNLVQRYSLRSQCKQHQNTQLLDVGKKSARVQNDRIPIQYKQINYNRLIQ
jgi:hypothetical protein